MLPPVNWHRSLAYAMSSRWPTRYESDSNPIEFEHPTTDWRHGPSVGIGQTPIGDVDFYDDSDNSDDYEDYDRPVHATSSYPAFPRRPLIDACTNDWKSGSRYYSNSPDRAHDDEDIVQLCIATLKAPKVRRYLLVYCVLFITAFLSWTGIIQPRWREHRELTSALNEGLRLNKGGWFGINVRPQFANMIQLQTLDQKLLPRSGKTEGTHRQRRLVIIGDVHGCKDELVRLLDKVSFDPATDHLIFTGDLLSKGPDSFGVVDLARELGASCVRGNHEDRILLVRRDLNHNMFPETVSKPELGQDGRPIAEVDSHAAIAQALSNEQVEWLQACPVILRVGPIEGMGEVVVVHAGLVPGVELEKQDPSAAMNMRTIELDTHVPSKAHEGMPWTKLWNKHQSLLSTSTSSEANDVMKAPTHHTTVVYGHDARRGLQIDTYTKGLDSSCVKGGKLTAMVISTGGRQKIYQVKCQDHVRPKSKN